MTDNRMGMPVVACLLHNALEKLQLILSGAIHTHLPITGYLELNSDDMYRGPFLRSACKRIR